MTAADRLFVETTVAEAGDAFVLDPAFRLEPLGKHAAEALKDRKGRPAVSQIRSLENVALSARTVADILDHVKRQSGRSTTGPMWMTERKGEPFGPALLATLDRVIALTEPALAAADRAGDLDLTRHLRLGLVRRFILALAAEYLYRSTPPADS